MLEERDLCIKSIEITNKLEHFVERAMEQGILKSSEAKMIHHEMNHHLDGFTKRVADLRNGRIEKPMYLNIEAEERARSLSVLTRSASLDNSRNLNSSSSSHSTFTKKS